MHNETPGWQFAAKHHALKIWLDPQTPLYFQHIPAGQFRMGSRRKHSREEPVHTVMITRPFYMGTFPVTQAQWRAVVNQFYGSELNQAPSHFLGDRRPVEQVSWHDVTLWCRLVSDSELTGEATDSSGNRIVLTKPQLDLPTEAQWEYACRGGTDTEYNSGDGEAALSVAGWYEKTSKQQTQDVGSLTRNAYGLYDLHGNVWEWCHDAFSVDVYKRRMDGVRDPEVSAADVGESESLADRVIRGGSWLDSAGNCHAASRPGRWPDNRFRYLGFRVCLFPGPVPHQDPAVEVKSEAESVDSARRQAAAGSTDSGVDVTELDLSGARFPERSDGTKF